MKCCHLRGALTSVIGWWRASAATPGICHPELSASASLSACTDHIVACWLQANGKRQRARHRRQERWTAVCDAARATRCSFLPSSVLPPCGEVTRFALRVCVVLAAFSRCQSHECSLILPTIYLQRRLASARFKIGVISQVSVVILSGKILCRQYKAKLYPCYIPELTFSAK